MHAVLSLVPSMYKHVVHEANESITTDQHGTLHCLLHSFPHIRQPISFIHCGWLQLNCMSMTFIQQVCSLMYMQSFVVCTACKMYGWCESIVLSFPFCLAGFEGSIPICGCSENIFVTCSCYFFRNGKPREERWEGRLRGRCMVCKIQKFRTSHE